MITGGFIKIHRSILDWEWYDDVNTMKLFLHLLLTVNIKDDRWHGIEVPAGSRIVSYPTLATELKLTNRQIRTALAHLETTGSVTRTKYPKCTVVSVTNWEQYQGNRQGKWQPIDSHSVSQASAKRPQNKNNKNIEEYKNSAAALVSPSAMLPGETPEEALARIRRLAE